MVRRWRYGRGVLRAKHSLRGARPPPPTLPPPPPPPRGVAGLALGRGRPLPFVVRPRGRRRPARRRGGRHRRRASMIQRPPFGRRPRRPPKQRLWRRHRRRPQRQRLACRPSPRGQPPRPPRARAGGARGRAVAARFLSRIGSARSMERYARRAAQPAGPKEAWPGAEDDDAACAAAAPPRPPKKSLAARLLGGSRSGRDKKGKTVMSRGASFGSVLGRGGRRWGGRDVDGGGRRRCRRGRVRVVCCWRWW